ncbi:hypothetical protein [Streptomyces bambusae]|uniref:Uncharacterized protein n=1 Tax=Streptomyces bambusae TaxID=1550616 RepID=A0ABS6ZDK8_9ACTN|nr:hypothetical protein [Streptomyces bambusae]MBW5485849.1 hypothetical protein [Streptomyces bambusae]
MGDGAGAGAVAAVLGRAGCGFGLAGARLPVAMGQPVATERLLGYPVGTGVAGTARHVHGLGWQPLGGAAFGGRHTRSAEIDRPFPVREVSGPTGRCVRSHRRSSKVDVISLRPRSLLHWTGLPVLRPQRRRGEAIDDATRAAAVPRSLKIGWA